MNTQNINEFLQMTRKTAEVLYKEKKDNTALTVLATGSKLAELSLNAIGFQTTQFACKEMHHILKGKIEQDAYIHEGICVYCEHLQGETETTNTLMEETYE